jgi:hypothetical protein
LWLSCWGDLTAPFHLVQPHVAENRLGAADHRGGDVAAPVAHHAADFEQVGKVGRKIQVQPAALRPDIEIVDGDALMAGALPQEFRPPDVQHFARQHNGIALVDVGIGEIDRQHDIVVLHRAGQQQRPLAIDQELDAGKIAGVVVKNPARGKAGIDTIAQSIEHGEAVALLESAGPALLNGFRRLNIKA